MVTDSFDRTIDYVRIAVTDRCNLRCFYCMPEQGIPYEPKAHLLSYEEITRLLYILASLGFNKVRFTGGEPFLRKDFIKLLERTANIGHYKSINITTNGTLINRHLDTLKELGINNINLSLDSLNPQRFAQITRRNDFDKVLNTFYTLLDKDFKIKINAVIMHGINTQDILPMLELAKKHQVSVRFIEEMPFNGGNKNINQRYTAKDIYNTLKQAQPSLKPIKQKHGDTANLYHIDNYKGDVGIIAAFSRTFCNTCNRLRITAKGAIKTCLYDNGIFSLRDFIRDGATDLEIANKIQTLIKLKPVDGFAAEKQSKKAKIRESMSTIGG